MPLKKKIFGLVFIKSLNAVIPEITDLVGGNGIFLVVFQVHLERYLQALLKLSDDHSDHFLLRTVSPACQQMLHAQLAVKRRVENYV